MVTTIQHPVYGTMTYSESIWTGKKELAVNGVPLSRSGKNMFVMDHNGEKIAITVTGNELLGAKANIRGEVIQLVAPAKWYEIAATIVTVVFFLTWGNSVVLCSIIPLIGGAIGGAIAGLGAALGLAFMKGANTWWKKVLIWLASFAAVFAINYLLAAAILSALV